MNWGTKIAIGLGTFMLFIIGACIYMVSKDSDSLIDNDYYERGLTYDEEYTRKTNVVQHQAQPSIDLETDSLTIRFTTPDNAGNIKLIRPSDGKQDKIIAFYAPDQHYGLSTSTLRNGAWILELSWESQGVPYIHTQTILIK